MNMFYGIGLVHVMKFFSHDKLGIFVLAYFSGNKFISFFLHMMINELILVYFKCTCKSRYNTYNIFIKLPMEIANDTGFHGFFL